MKKLKKLSLNKEVVTKLQNDEMQRLNGGLGKSHWFCMTYFKTGGCYGSKVSTTPAIYCSDITHH